MKLRCLFFFWWDTYLAPSWSSATWIRLLSTPFLYLAITPHVSIIKINTTIGTAPLCSFGAVTLTMLHNISNVAVFLQLTMWYHSSSTTSEHCLRLSECTRLTHRSRDIAVRTLKTSAEMWLSRDNSPHSNRSDAKKSTTPATTYRILKHSSFPPIIMLAASWGKRNVMV